MLGWLLRTESVKTSSVAKVASWYLQRRAMEKIPVEELPEHVSDVVALVQAEGGHLRAAWDSIHGWSTDYKGPAKLDPASLSAIVNHPSFRWIEIDFYTGKEVFPSNPDTGTPLMGGLNGSSWRVEKKEMRPFTSAHRGMALPFRTLSIGQTDLA